MNIIWGTNPGAIGVHTSRTIMYREVSLLLGYLPDSSTDFKEYEAAVLEKNMLGLKTVSNRVITWKNLTQLYGFRDTPLFRNFRRLWFLVPEKQRPVLSLVVAMSRDRILRESAAWISNVPHGNDVTSVFFLENLNSAFPGRYSLATARSTSQSLFSSWTHAGWLGGSNPARRPRQSPDIGAGSLSLALFVAWSEGLRGEQLFETPISRVVLNEVTETKTLLWEAHRNSFLNYYDSGGLSDIRFPGWLTAREEEILHGTL